MEDDHHLLTAKNITNAKQTYSEQKGYRELRIRISQFNGRSDTSQILKVNH